MSFFEFISLTPLYMISYDFAGKKQKDKLQVKMKRSTQASLTDMFNKMSKVSKPTRPESSEEMQQVHDRQAVSYTHLTLPTICSV